MEMHYALIEAPTVPLLLINVPTTLPISQLTPIITTELTPSPAPITVDPMEALWHTQFDQLFNNFWPSKWRLIPKLLVGYNAMTNWRTHSDAAKVRFLCQVCGHGWTSMKGRVVFWYNFNPREGYGTVAFELFGQKCQECKSDGLENFTPAMWYQEEVIKVLYNVYNRVGQTYYGFQHPWYVRNRRPGKPRSQHASELCQACELGVCSVGNAKKEGICQSNTDHCELDFDTRFQIIPLNGMQVTVM